MFARRTRGGELIPKLRRLILVVPLEILRARRKIPLLRTSRIFVAADTSDERIPLVLRHHLLQRHRLQFVRHRHRVGRVVADGPALRISPASRTSVLVDFHDEVQPVIFHRPVAISDHLREFIRRINVQQRIRNVPAKRLSRQPNQNIGILAHAPRHADFFEMMKRLTNEENALRFKRIKMSRITASNLLRKENRRHIRHRSRVKFCVSRMFAKIEIHGRKKRGVKQMILYCLSEKYITQQLTRFFVARSH